MKQYLIKGILVAGVAFLTVPAIAQQEKKGKEEKKEVEQIIITRRGDTDDKTVIEINGDKIKINGKEVEGNREGDVSVRRHKLNRVRDMEALVGPARPGSRSWSFDINDDAVSLFTEDENRAMLGVVTEEDEKGAVIVSVSKESAAEKAGLKKGDIITRIDEDKIEDAEDVSQAIRKHKPGDKITLSILRDGKEQKITAELGKWKGVKMNSENFRITTPIPSLPNLPFELHGNTLSIGGPKLGISIQDSEDGKGVKVLEVDEESNAAKAGIKEDDVITHVNDKAVNSVDEITRLVRENRNQPSIRFQVVRGGKSQNIEVKVPRKLKTADL